VARNVEQVDDREALVQAQAPEIERLKRELAEAADRVSRRGIVKGLGIGSLVALGAAGAALGGTQAVQAAPPGVQASGDIAGDLPVKLLLKAGNKPLPSEDGRDGSIDCVYFDSGVKSPRDSASGQATGKRQHSPITIRKRIDTATPLIAKALVQNEVIDAEIRFFRRGSESNPEHFFTITLQDGRVVEQQLYVP
jgi:type VI secretion system secreted protein Hcp